MSQLEFETIGEREFWDANFLIHLPNMMEAGNQKAAKNDLPGGISSVMEGAAKMADEAVLVRRKRSQGLEERLRRL